MIKHGWVQTRGLAGFMDAKNLKFRGVPVIQRDDVPPDKMYFLNSNHMYGLYKNLSKIKKGNPFMEIKIEKAKNGYVLRVERDYTEEAVYVFKTMGEMTAAMPQIVADAEKADAEAKAKKEGNNGDN